LIRIVDCGSQLTQNIARRVRERGVFTEIVPFNKDPREVLTDDLEGLIISGGPFSVHQEDANLYSRKLLEAGVPTLGICYGLQSIAKLLGGKVTSTNDREYGETRVKLLKKDHPLFKFEKGTPDDISVWMSHGDIVEKVPPGFSVLAESQSGHVAAMAKENIMAVQFHPEVDHTQYGMEILDNFIELSGAQRTWDPTKDYDRLVAELKDKIAGKTGIGGISGGVDSTTLSVLLGQVAGKDYHPIFVDNGLLRLNEASEVLEMLDQFDLNVSFEDASIEFLAALKGVTNPDEKRKIIGHKFIEAFKRVAEGIPGASYLAQGTLYPDVVESVVMPGMKHAIKRHHNVGGLPKDLGFELVEPFKYMFKDDVRKIAADKLDMPKDVVERHPFPGPGLGIRILGEVTPDKLGILRQADAIFIDELKSRGLYYEMAQAFAVLASGQTVGVQGDAGTYEGIIGLRAVTTKDFMTTDWYDFEKNDLTAIANRIMNEVNGVGRVVLDVSQKPPSTVEWE